MEQQGETGITQISPVFPKRHQLLVVAEVDAASLKILRFLSWDAQSAHCPAEIPLAGEAFNKDVVRCPQLWYHLCFVARRRLAFDLSRRTKGHKASEAPGREDPIRFSSTSLALRSTT